MFEKKMLGTTLLALVLAGGISAAALIQPELVSTLETAGAGEKLPVEFFMKQQVNALDLDPGIPDIPKPLRRARVAEVLQAFSAQSQRELLAVLNAGAAEGKVEDVRSLWICNMVSCWATKEVIYEMAARSDVELVLYTKVPVELGKLDLSVPPAAADAIEPNMVVTNVRGAWAQGYHGEDVVIGVVDTGVRYTHDDLKDHLWTSSVYPSCGFNYASNQFSSGHPGPSTYDTLTPLDYYGHGTHCAGIATADGAYGNGTRDTMGIAPATKIMSVPVDVYLHSPYPDTSMENNTMLGFQFCVSPPRDPTNGADVITTSLGLISSWLPRRAIFRACEVNILAAGVVHCIAAGNESSARTIRTPGDCPPPWPNPANHPSDKALSAVITVGATDNSDNAASFTSKGPSDWGSIAPYNDYAYPPGLIDPDVCMPGVNILSTYYSNDRSYTTMSGTSMATPGAAGVCCLMLSKNPTLTPREIDSILELHAVKDLGPTGKDNTFGAGRINCSLAVALTPFPGPRHDVALSSILAPGLRVDPAVAIAPSVVVRNNGTYDETSVPVHCKIDSAGTQIYGQLVTMPTLDSAVTDTVIFPNWTPGQGGNVYALTFWHSFSPDTNRANDTLLRTVTVRGHDVAATNTNMSGRVRSGQPVAPNLTLEVAGDYSERSFPATCRIDSTGAQVYSQTVTVDSVMVGTPKTVTFPNWTPGPDSFVYDVTLFHSLAGDQVRGNDTLYSTVAPRGHSVWSVSMNIGGRVRAGTPFSPALTVQSADYTEHAVVCYCWVDSAGTRIYNQSTTLDSVVAGATATATFPAWNVGPAGAEYDVTMFNTFADPNRSDDTLRRSTEATDQMNVLVLHADSPPESLRVGLTWLGDSVTLRAANSGTTPKLAELIPYDGVITFSNSTYINPVAMGDTLAAYVDLGYPVVISTFGFTTGWAMQGRIMTGDYVTLVPASNSHNTTDLGWFNPAHPIMADVDTVHDVYVIPNTWAPGADTVAKWANGMPYVATSPNQQVVGINNYAGPVNSNRGGRDWVKVFHNALLWASGGGVGLEGKQPFSVNPGFVLCTSRPNPFRDRTTIRYNLPNAAGVRLLVYDASGRAKATLVNGRRERGWQDVTWDRTDNSGARVASGIYFYKLTSGDYSVTRKLVIE